MNGIFAGVYLFSLQTQRYFKEDDPLAGLQIGIIAGGIVIIFLAARLIRSKGRKTRGKNTFTGFAPRRLFSRLTLNRIASEYGLNRDQKKLLDFILRNDGTGDPQRLLESPDSQDRIFRNAVKTIERNSKSDDQFQQQMAKIYTLRNIMEADPEESGGSSAKTPGQRRFKRRPINASCSISFVKVKMIKNGRKKTAKLVVENRSHKGTMQDISVGGCAISTSAPVQGDSTLKIDFYCSGDGMISVLGQVVRSNRSTGTQTIIHVKFLKVPRRAFNEINSLIFGYN